MQRRLKEYLSQIAMMGYELLEYFTRSVIQGPARDHDGRAESSSSTVHNASTVDEPSNQNNDQDKNQEFKFGIYDGLRNLIQRISSLHSREHDQPRTNPNPNPNPNPTTISEAIAIWQDLRNWEPPDSPPPLPDYSNLYGSYTSALFIWLHFIVHPDSMGDEKVQTMLQTGLNDVSAVETLELLPFLVIPVFIHGLACMREEDRGIIEREFDRIDGQWARDCKDVKVDVYREIVRDSWRKQDSGIRRSWDWACLIQGMSS